MVSNLLLDDCDKEKMEKLNNILPNIGKKWNYYNECQSCNIEFGNISNRDHHCRCCGKSYCKDCSNNKIYLPECILDFPDEKDTYNSKYNYFMSYLYNSSHGTLQKTVCNECYKKLIKINKIAKWISLLKFMPFNKLHELMIVSKDFYDAVLILLFKFKLIQYKENFDSWDIGILKSSSKFLLNHSEWIKTCIKIMIHEHYSTCESSFNINQLLNNNSDNKINCSNIFCSLLCKKKLNIYDFIEILNYLVIHNNVNNVFWTSSPLKFLMKIIINNISHPNIITINNVTPILLRNLIDLTISDEKNIDNDVIFPIFDLILIDKKKTEDVCNLLNIITVDCDKCNNLNHILNQYINIKKHHDININDDIYTEKQRKMFDFIVHIYYNNNLGFINSYLPSPYFLDSDFEISEVIESRKRDKDIILTMKIKHKDGFTITKKKIIIKKVDDLEIYYMNHFIKIMTDKVYAYNLRFNNQIMDFPTCDIRMISPKFCVIEIPCESWYLNYLHMNNISLKEFIIDINMNKTVEKMIKTFSSNLQLYVLFTHIFDLERNNKNSLMINDKGQIFLSYHEIKQRNKVSKTMTSLLTNNYRKVKVPEFLCNILGPINGHIHTNFINNTIQHMNMLYVHQNFIKSYLSLMNINTFMINEKIHDCKNISDILISYDMLK